MKHQKFQLGVIILVSLVMVLSGCGGSSDSGDSSNSISSQTAADAIHAVLEADRTAYTRLVVNRLDNQENIIQASEHWEEDKALPLPAQMFRAGAEISREKNKDFSYSLLSLWAVNKQNTPKTDVEREGLEYVAETGENFYGQEALGDQNFFVAVYPDVAIAEACIACHNSHPDSPRDDFKLDDVMGGVVIRLPLDG